MPRWIKRLAAILAAAATGGCATVGPDFARPAPPSGPAAEAYAMAGDVAAPGVRLTPETRQGGAWWQAFGSDALDRVVRLAFAESPTLREGQATLERFQAEARAADGERRPQAAATGDARRERINTQAFGFSGFPSPTINLYSVGAAVDYDLDLFGGRRRASEAARARSEQAARQADAAYLTISANIAIQAMRIAGLRAEIAALEAVVEDDRQTLDMVRKGLAAGGRPPAAATNAIAQLSEDEALLPPLRRELDAARHALAALAGKAPAEWTAPAFELSDFATPAEAPVSLPSALVRRRPDILAAEAELHAATAEVGVAVADQYPNLRLTAAFAQSAVRPGSLFGYDASGWNLGAGVAAPLFSGGRLKAERQAAEAEARAALARYQQTVLRAFVQVSDALTALAAAEDEVSALERGEAAARRRARTAEDGYRLGGVSLLDVVAARRELSRVTRDLAQARGRRLADHVQLYAATAADWRGS